MEVHSYRPPFVAGVDPRGLGFTLERRLLIVLGTMVMAKSLPVNLSLEIESHTQASSQIRRRVGCTTVLIRGGK
jgi:hypothetical protein